MSMKCAVEHSQDNSRWPSDWSRVRTRRRGARPHTAHLEATRNHCKYHGWQPAAAEGSTVSEQSVSEAFCGVIVIRTNRGQEVFKTREYRDPDQTETYEVWKSALLSTRPRPLKVITRPVLRSGSSSMTTPLRL